MSDQPRPEAIDQGAPDTARVRRRVAIELAVLGALTPAFLLLFPDRATFVDMGLALFALAAIALTVRDTRDRVWGPLPPEAAAAGLRRSALWMLALTGPLVAVFCAIGVARGNRLFEPRLALALAVYLPWALAQQTLFQFYLLGRLRALLPGAPPIALAALTGAAYGLVHLPDAATTLVTIPAGIAWSLSYWHHRRLIPIALSHAVLGSTFYYWAMGRDVVEKALSVMS